MSLYFGYGSATFGILSAILWFVASAAPIAQLRHMRALDQASGGHARTMFANVEESYVLMGVRMNAAAAAATGVASLFGALAIITSR